MIRLLVAYILEQTLHNSQHYCHYHYSWVRFLQCILHFLRQVYNFPLHHTHYTTPLTTRMHKSIWILC